MPASRSSSAASKSEAQLVAQLESLHIVPLYDYWRDPTGAFLVMRWLRGGSLEGVLKRDGALSADATLKLLEQVSAALAVAHRNRIIHRDLKPANILLDEEGNAYLSDFGIAKSLGSKAGVEDADDGLTGSPAYMSPEQIRQTPVTARTDIYSLGCVLYEVLSGQPPFAHSSTAELFYKHLNEPLPPLYEARPDLPDQLDMVIQRATAKNPAERYANVLEMYAEFRQGVLDSQSAAKFLEGRDNQTIEIIDFEAELADFEAANPYKGLRAFQEGDAADFFGRSALTDQLLKRLAEPVINGRFLAVVGPSGSGKSSVVKAGLIPILRQGGLPDSASWFYLEMTPRLHPMEQLAEALLKVALTPQTDLLERMNESERGLYYVLADLLAGQNTDLVLVIDQFEEVFTLVESEAERALFLHSIRVAATAPNSRLRLIITLRADFYDRPLQYQAFGELMRQRTEVVLPLSPDELTEAIVQPAERVGVRMNVDLVEAILRDVGEQPGTLPLLQYALTELFERRQGRLLTVGAYKESGGVLGSLARRADELYVGLNTAQKEATRQLFLRLVTLGEGVEDTRRRVRRVELIATVGDETMLDGIIDQFSRYRLLTSDRDPVTRGPTVEVAHEALIRTWSRLRDWLAASREALRLQRQLLTAATDWEAAGNDPSFLATGVRLAQFETLLASNLALNQEERRYLDRSIAERKANESAEEARRQHELQLAQEATAQAQKAAASAEKEAAASQKAEKAQRSAAQRLRILLIGAMLALIVSLGLAGIAVKLRGDAVDSAILSDSLKFSSDASSQLPGSSNNAELAALLAIRSLKTRYTTQADTALGQAVQLLYTTQLLRGHSGIVYSVAASPDGKTLATASKDGTAKLWSSDANGGHIKLTLSGHTDAVHAVAFSPDGQYVLTGSYDHTAILWDSTSGKQLHVFQHKNNVNAVAFSPDGQFIATGSSDNAATVWNIATGEQVRRFDTLAKVVSVAFSPDGQSLATGGSENFARLWNIASGALVQKFVGHLNYAQAVAFSPDGKSLLTGSADNTAKLWNIATGQVQTTFRGHSGQLFSVAFSQDGTRILTGAYDGTARLWDASSGAELRQFLGHAGPVYSAVFLPNSAKDAGKTVLSGGDDKSARLWDAAVGPELRRLTVNDKKMESVAISHDGRYIATGSADTNVYLWDAQTFQQIRIFSGHTKLLKSVTFSPDDKYILTAADDATARLWDVATGKQLREFVGHAKAVNSAMFAPDGTTILTASNDGTVRLWDAATGNLIRSYTASSQAIYRAVFSPDGKTFVSVSQDHTAKTWDVQSGKALITYTGHTNIVYTAAFSADGTKILTAGYDNVAQLWDAATGKTLATLTGHQGTVFSVAFSPDGQHILTGSGDGTAKLWDLSGKNERTLVGHTNQIVSVAYAPDGLTVATASWDGTVRVWDADYRNLMSFACTRVFQDMSVQNLKTYYIDENQTPDTDPTCPQFSDFSTQMKPLPPVATPYPLNPIPVLPPLPMGNPTRIF